MTERLVPLFLGPANSEAATGCSWRWVRDMSRTLGVPLLRAGKKQLVDAAKFQAALEVLAGDSTNSEVAVGSDPAAELRKRLGLRLVGGAR